MGRAGRVDPALEGGSVDNDEAYENRRSYCKPQNSVASRVCVRLALISQVHNAMSDCTRLEALTNAKRLPSDLMVGELRIDLTCFCLPPAVLTTYNTVVLIVAAFLCRGSGRNTSLALSKGLSLSAQFCSTLISWGLIGAKDVQHIVLTLMSAADMSAQFQS